MELKGYSYNVFMNLHNSSDIVKKITIMVIM
ncbi:hypothetical protein CcarbDRAFT_2209 [Clostridium carboxidivorans P7]|uniref:Uncharacterized protein n=1 Tax=Clostridium carboxidivorans P7 TaxID=536227 RepID=C6PTU2_9CLOT|nr:hypothetical protein CcarbDRAFT_2209 [Clostridium carboxidivorans P7]